MGNFSYSFLRCPSIEFLRAAVPEDDDARGIAYKNGIMGKFNDAFEDSRDLSVKREFRLIGKKGRGAHALPSFLELRTPMMPPPGQNQDFGMVISWKISGIHLLGSIDVLLS
jgi:hypothetical protein